MSPLNAGGSVRLNRLGRLGNPNADWFNHRYLLPPPGKTSFGYYAGPGNPVDQDPSFFEAAFGRTVDHTVTYQPGSSYRSTGSPNLNNTDLLRANIVKHLNAGRMVRQSIGFQHLAGQKIVKGTEFWQRIGNGDLDEDGVFGGVPYKGIKSWMRMLSGLGRRIMVSPWHEFDGDNGIIEVDANGYCTGSGGQRAWYGSGYLGNYGTSADRDLISANFRSAWQHVVTLTRTLVTQEGGHEPVWTFLNAVEPAALPLYGKPKIGDVLTDTGSDGFYPGHNFVDIVGCDPYNHGGLAAQPGANWNNPQDLWNNGQTQYRAANPTSNWWDNHFKVGGARNLATAVGNQGVYKPAMWGETGTNEYWPGSPYNSNFTYPYHRVADGDATTWMQQLIDLVSPGGAAYGKLKYITWFSVDYWNPKVIPYNGNGTRYGMAGFDDTVLRPSFTDSSGTEWPNRRWSMVPVLGQAEALKTR